MLLYICAPKLVLLTDFALIAGVVSASKRNGLIQIGRVAARAV